MQPEYLEVKPGIPLCKENSTIRLKIRNTEQIPLENLEALITGSLPANDKKTINKFVDVRLLQKPLASNETLSIKYEVNASIGTPLRISLYPIRHITMGRADAGLVTNRVQAVSANISDC